MKVVSTLLRPHPRQFSDGATVNLNFASCRWGLIPSWAKAIGKPLINARSETAHEKPTFRGSFKSKRCLVFASGYFEWIKTEDGKQPFYIQNDDATPMLFYGLWSRWRGPKTIDSYTILTTDAADDVSSIHDRMPCIADLGTDLDTWLNPEFGDVTHLLSLLQPKEGLKATRVSKYVNSVRNQGAECVEAI